MNSQLVVDFVRLTDSLVTEAMTVQHQNTLKEKFTQKWQMSQYLLNPIPMESWVRFRFPLTSGASRQKRNFKASCSSSSV